MEKIGVIIDFIIFYKEELMALPLAILAVAEIIFRLLPTKDSKGLLEKIGENVRKVLDIFDKIVPNKKKGGGTHPKVKEEKEAQSPPKE